MYKVEYLPAYIDTEHINMVISMAQNKVFFSFGFRYLLFTHIFNACGKFTFNVGNKQKCVGFIKPTKGTEG